jgi:hypothetical protein
LALDFENATASRKKKTISGEESDDARDIASSGREEQLKYIIKQYSLNDVYNANETVLLYSQ